MRIDTKKVDTFETKLYCDSCQNELVLINKSHSLYNYECPRCINSRCSINKLYPIITYQDAD
jgi:transcription elongation factor Elf1